MMRVNSLLQCSLVMLKLKVMKSTNNTNSRSLSLIHPKNSWNRNEVGVVMVDSKHLTIGVNMAAHLNGTKIHSKDMQVEPSWRSARTQTSSSICSFWCWSLTSMNLMSNPLGSSKKPYSWMWAKKKPLCRSNKRSTGQEINGSEESTTWCTYSTTPKKNTKRKRTKKKDKSREKRIKKNLKKKQQRDDIQYENILFLVLK